MSETPSGLDKMKSLDPTSKAIDAGVDKVLGAKEGDGAVASAAKATAGAGIKGTLEGAKKGGLHGAAVGAATGVGKALVKDKNSRSILIALVIIMMLPGLLMGVGLLGAMNMSSSQAVEMELEGQGQAAGGLSDDELSAIRRAADEESVPWPILMALYKAQQNTGSTGLEYKGTAGSGSPIAGSGSFSLGANCDPWTAKVGTYLNQHWGNNEKGSGRIGCQRDEANSDHNGGNALDYMIVPHDESALGKEVATFLMKNAKALGIKYLIFEQKIWNPTRDAYGEWRDMESRGTLAADHYDHIHISFTHPGAEGAKTPSDGGTYDLTITDKPTITAADIEAAFGGSGSGGVVPGYESYQQGSAATSGLPFGILDDAPGKPDKEKVKPEDLMYESAKYIATKLKETLNADSTFHGEDIGTGLALNSDNKVVVQNTEAERSAVEKSYVAAFMKLPVDGHTNEMWAKNVWLFAISYRMGQEPDVCSAQPPTVLPETDPSASASPTPSPSPSTSPTTAPTGTPTIPTGTWDGKPFVVKPSAPYPGASSADYNKVTITEKELKNVAIVSAVAKELFPEKAQYERAMMIAVTTMLVETGARNTASEAVPESKTYPHDAVFPGDHDSVGIFQQRVNVGYYGTAQQLMDPYYQAYMFFGAPKALHGPLPANVASRGLLQYGKPGNHISNLSLGKDWMVEPIGKVAQTIQGSAHPDRYELWVQDAPQVIAAATGIQIDGMNPGGCIQSMDAIGAGGALGIAPASGKIVSPIPDGAKGVSMSARYGRYPSGGKHFGIDLTSGSSWTIQSICDGTVKSININDRYANSNAYKATGSTNYIWIDCGNGVLMGYAHFFARELSSDLKVGMKIGAGTPLFPMGNQGNSSGPHLHLQISTSNSTAYSREATVDPVAYLSQFGISLPKPGY